MRRHDVIQLVDVRRVVQADEADDERNGEHRQGCGDRGRGAASTGSRFSGELMRPNLVGRNEDARDSLLAGASSSASKRSRTRSCRFLRQVVSHCATPPCPEQLPLRCAECEYIPSLHFAVAPVGSLSSALPELPVALDVVAAGAAVRTRSEGGAGAGAGGAVDAGRSCAPSEQGRAPERGLVREQQQLQPRRFRRAWSTRRALPSTVVPSVQVTELPPLAAFFAAAVAFASTPPCPEHAPRPVAVEVVPSVHTLAAVACAATRTRKGTKSGDRRRGKSKRMCMKGLRNERRAGARHTAHGSVQILAIRIILPRQGIPDMLAKKSLCTGVVTATSSSTDASR